MPREPAPHTDASAALIAQIRKAVRAGLEWIRDVDTGTRARQRDAAGAAEIDGAIGVIRELARLLEHFESGVAGPNPNQLTMAWARAAKLVVEPELERDARRMRAAFIITALRKGPASTRDLLALVQHHGVGCSPSKLKLELETLERLGSISREARGRQGAKLWIVRSSSTDQRS
jgi:hypothetical protein